MKKQVRFRHRVVIFFAKLLLVPYYKIKYNYKYKRLKYLKKGKPYLILANHALATDPIMVGFGFPFHIYYFATQQIFNLGLISKLLVFAANPISKAKAATDTSAIRKARAIVKEGGSIGLFPEGNVTYSGATVTIDVSTVKLIKLLKIPVVIFKTEGLFLSNPRWAVYPKRGKSHGYVHKIINPEEYENLDDNQLLELVRKDLYVNSYTQENRVFKGKHIAVGLERLAFMDLILNIPNVNYTKNNLLLSTKSDFKLIYNLDGTVNYSDQEITLIELEDLTKKSYLTYLKTISNNDVILSTEVDVNLSTPTKKYKPKTFELSLFKDKFTFYDTTLKTIYLKDIKNFSIQGKKKLIIYLEEETLLVTLDLQTSPFIFLLTYQIDKQIIGENYDLISISTLGL